MSELLSPFVVTIALGIGLPLGVSLLLVLRRKRKKAIPRATSQSGTTKSEGAARSESAALGVKAKREPSFFLPKLLLGLKDLVQGRRLVDDNLLAEIGQKLISADVGTKVRDMLLEKLVARVPRGVELEPHDILKILAEEMLGILEAVPAQPSCNHKPRVILMVGVNGAGKTTTTAKLGYLFLDEGKSVLFGAADTFRAAAIQQLQEWGSRLGLEVIAQAQGADPAAVCFDALSAAIARGKDVLILDTAGRLQNKEGLMAELAKIKKVVAKKLSVDAKVDTWIVLDATLGQNAFSQLEAFRDATDVNGIIMTKLDGSAKGGALLGLVHEFKIPVVFVGVGEKMEDLRPFDKRAYLRSLLGEDYL